jgi:preprotein translocase subunit SecB
MTSNGPSDATPNAADAGVPPLIVNGQYIKDLSFEVPGAPGIYGELTNKEPQISVNVEVQAKAAQETLFEVTLHIVAECKVGESIAFVCELAYAGLFTIVVPREHLQAMLLIECPRLLFPFARNIIADATRDGAFPPLMLSPVDFAAMFRNKVASMGQEAPSAPQTA